MRLMRGTLATVIFLLIAQAAFAATFTVTKTADSNDGTCNTDCSLREAVAAANNAATDDIIDFDPAVFGTAQTVSVTLGEIVIGAMGTLTINGTGANLLTIDGNMGGRIMTTGAGVIATINDATFTNGTGVGATNTGRGGAIYNNLGTLTLNNLIITGNTAANGGGVNNAGTGSVLTVNNCIISNNTTTSSGGGIQNFSTSTLTINKTTFSGNMGGSTTGGGGAQLNGTVRITNSTFANNTAPIGAGGGFQSNGSSLIMTNVTVSGNTSATNGGGIHRGTTNVNFFIRNSIVAGNNGVSTSPDVTNSTGGITSEGNNIIGNVGTSTGWVMSDLINTNPMLGMLSNNGGFGQTLLPMPGSPAIDAGQNCVVDLTCTSNNPPTAVTTDQRGIVRPQGATVDIGSVEVVPVPLHANISGRVLSPNGTSAGRVVVTITNMGNLVQVASTSDFGYFKFSEIRTGQTYTINVLSKQYNFTPQAITVNGDIAGLELNATSEN